MREGINGPEVQLLAGNEGDNTGRYRPGSYTNPETGAVANRAQVGMVGERWVPVSDYVVRRSWEPGGRARARSAAGERHCAHRGVSDTPDRPRARQRVS